MAIPTIHIPEMKYFHYLFIYYYLHTQIKKLS